MEREARRRARRLVVSALVATTVGVGWWAWALRDPLRLPKRLTIEDPVVDLSETFDRAAVAEERSDDPVAAGRLQPGSALAPSGASRRAIVAPPPSRLRFRVRAPAGAVLRFGAAAEQTSKRADHAAGVRFAVLADGRELFARTLDPVHRRDRRWVDDAVDLGVTAERDVELELRTTAAGGGDRVSGRPGWSHVRLVRRTTRDRQPAGPATPNVLVLLVDTLRADRLGCYGARPSPSPTLDTLAAGGRVFEQAISQASWTMPAVATYFTGLHPRSHGVVAGTDPTATADGGSDPSYLADSIPTIAAEAEDAGITTIAVTASPLVSRDTNLTRGFETVEEFGWTSDRARWTPAAEVNAHFLRWLHANRRHRFLAYLHYMDVHDPYTPPAPFRPPVPDGVRAKIAAGEINDIAIGINRHGAPPLSEPEVSYLRALYDGEIAAWDAELARLLAGLDAAGVRDSTVIIVLADHGEEFQDHGKLKHGIHLYDELVRIPLVIAGPGIAPARATAQVQGIDLFPTLAARLGLHVPATLPGQDVLGEYQARAALSETRYGIGADGGPTPLFSLRTSRWKLIAAPAGGRYELFDVAADPAELHDRFATAPEAVGLVADLGRLEAALPPPPRTAGHDPGLEQKLRALGYVE